ncbi:hypothetical protein J3E68DRAFT_268223 [Trichoderma sp. SZMC 28012]
MASCCISWGMSANVRTGLLRCSWFICVAWILWDASCTALYCIVLYMFMLFWGWCRWEAGSATTYAAVGCGGGVSDILFLYAKQGK